MEKSKDLLTQEWYYKRRSNQKFATATNRIKYNNIKARKKREAKAPFEKALDTNRTIISKILGTKSEIKVSRDYLLGAGFSFGYFMYQKSVNETTFSGIYEYGITKLSDGTYKIIMFSDGRAA